MRPRHVAPDHQALATTVACRRSGRSRSGHYPGPGGPYCGGPGFSGDACWRHLAASLAHPIDGVDFQYGASLLGVGLGTLVLGTTLAWLVVHYRFPGRGLFEWALMLPLAMPAYVLGFVFLGVFDFTGPCRLWYDVSGDRVCVSLSCARSGG